MRPGLILLQGAPAVVHKAGGLDSVYTCREEFIQSSTREEEETKLMIQLKW